MYFCVHCAFSFLKSYYSTHISAFFQKEKTAYNGQLIQISRVSAILTYFFVRCGVVALKSYYLPRSPSFYKVCFVVD